jgi:hypothetical protein
MILKRELGDADRRVCQPGDHNQRPVGQLPLSFAPQNTGLFSDTGTPREYNVFLLTVCHQFLIEEFSIVIGIDAQDGNWMATRSVSRPLSHYFKAHQSSPKHVSAQLENLVLFLQLSFLPSSLHRFFYIPFMNQHDLGI